MSVKINKISEDIQSISSSGKIIGFISKTDDKYTSMTLNGFTEFNNYDLALKFFTKDAHIDISKMLKQTLSDINGYPVKEYARTVITIIDSSEKPMFLRGKNSKHYAGYWLINISGKWVPSFCPTEKQIMEHDHRGPWKTEEEMRITLLSMNI